jgi:hypothetical protein
MITRKHSLGYCKLCSKQELAFAQRFSNTEEVGSRLEDIYITNS